MKPVLDEFGVTLYCGDCLSVLRTLPDCSVNCCVTSPPYWGLRDYGVAGQLGLEPTPAEYVASMVEVFREVRRVLRDDGTLWLNLGDSYASGEVGRHDARSERAKEFGCVQMDGPRQTLKTDKGCKTKDLVGVPWKVAFALRDDGWYLRSDIIWHKPACMPESVTDRPTKAHEYLFLLAKSDRYYYDAAAIAEIATVELAGPNATTSQKLYETGSGRNDSGEKVNGFGFVRSGEAWPVEKRNRRTVWSINPQPFPGAHFATFPPKLIEPCIKAGVPVGGVCLDPFFGAGTTGLVCQQQHVRCIGIELNPDYCAIATKRLAQGTLFTGAA